MVFHEEAFGPHFADSDALHASRRDFTASTKNDVDNIILPHLQDEAEVLL